MEKRCAVCGGKAIGPAGRSPPVRDPSAFICDACAARIRWEARERVGPTRPI